MFEFWSFFLILLAAVTFSTLFRRIHLPWVLALIVAGLVVGPHGFGWLQIDPTLDFLGQVGLVFLMFMAGLETPLSKITHGFQRISLLALINGVIPFLVGVVIARLFGYEWTAALLTGIVFISSSVALIIPSLEENNLIETKIGSAILSSTVLQDILSLLLLSLLLQNVQPEASLPLPIFYLILALLLAGGKTLVQQVRKFIHRFHKDLPDTFEAETRSVFVLMLGAVILFELLGLHAIIGGFFAGLMLSETINSKRLRAKLHAISFGIFIPIFFVIVGANTNIFVLSESQGAIALVIAIVLGSMVSKYVSGWVGAHAVGYNEMQSRLFAITSIPQLSTTLAAVFTGFSFGLIDQKLVTAMILLSLVTTFIAPIVTNRLILKRRKDLVSPSGYLD